MVSVDNIWRSFGGGTPVLAGTTFALNAGELIGLIGPSGSGKSVLLKIIAGVWRSDQGTISGVEKGSTSLMFQEGALFDSMSVFDNVAFPLVDGRVPCGLLPKGERTVVRDKVAEILGRVGLLQAAAKNPSQLSGGMRRRASLARALVARPEVLLLDDPTSGLDPIASRVIMNLIVQLHSEYRPTTIMVSQDLRRLLPLVPRVLALFQGRIVYDGTVPNIPIKAPEEVRRFVACRYDCGEREHSESPQMGV